MNFMDNIPLHKLETFDRFYVEQKNRAPLRHREQIEKKAVSYFSVFERDENPCKAEIDIHRSEFYKILLNINGHGFLIYGNKKYVVQPGGILFLKPTEVRSWQATSKDQEGYYCIFSEQFYAMTESHLRELRHGPHFSPGVSPVVSLDDNQSRIITPVFEKLYREFNGDYNIEILRMYLHILLLEASKIRGSLEKNSEGTPTSYILAQKFLELLETQFTSPENQAMELKFPSDFAEKLFVHNNHLNAIVKSVTGLTVREHIHRRLLAEAQLLLAYSKLNVSEISYRLSFREPTHFCSFFKKHLNTTPAEYKRSAGLQV